MKCVDVFAVNTVGIAIVFSIQREEMLLWICFLLQSKMEDMYLITKYFILHFRFSLKGAVNIRDNQYA